MPVGLVKQSPECQRIFAKLSRLPPMAKTQSSDLTPIARRDFN
jgi:hypothetical protein